MTPRRALVLAALAFVAIRIGLFLFAREIEGDAVPRALRGLAWANAPHLIRDSTGMATMYPFQIYAAGLGVLVAGSTRLPSLLFGCAVIVPLVLLARRTRDEWAPAVAVAALALFTLHAQASTFTISEAIFATWFLLGLELALRLVDEPGAGYAIGAGLCLLCAEGLRLDGWVYCGILGPIVLWHLGRARRFGLAALFAALIATFPIAWAATNYINLHDPFPEVTRNAAYHEGYGALYAREVGRTVAALRSLGFWPVTLAVSLSPGLFALGVIGVCGSWRERFTRIVVVVTVPLAILLSIQSLRGQAILVVRFTIVHGALLTIFVARGARVVAGWLGQRRRLARVLAAGVAVTAVALPVALVWRTHGRNDWVAERLRQLSPLADVAPAVAAADDWLTAHPASAVLFDHEHDNWELPTLYYSGLPAAAIHKLPSHDPCHSLPAVDCAVLFDGGTISGCMEEKETVTIGGRSLALVAAWPSPPGGVGTRIYCATGTE